MPFVSTHTIVERRQKAKRAGPPGSWLAFVLAVISQIRQIGRRQFFCLVYFAEKVPARLNPCSLNVPPHFLQLARLGLRPWPRAVYHRPMGKRWALPCDPGDLHVLPWRQQMCVRLVHDGYTEQQAAQILGVSRETVARELRAALAQLKSGRAVATASGC